MTTHSLSHAHHRQHGFSLLELSIALAVIGIVVAGGLTMSTSMVDRQAYVQTGNQMNEVDKAIAAYVAVNHRLPCPADPSLTLDAPDYGMAGPGACSAAPVQHTTGTGGRAVAIGMLPVRTLGLRDRMGADEYGNRYTYAVTESLTSSSDTGGYNDPTISGAITMADTGIDDAAYAVVSHGGDSKGAYRYETASNSVTCAGSAQDVENCNGDATFRDTRFNRGSVAGNWFDDSVRFARKEIINLNAGAANAGGTQLWAANGDDIYNTNSQNVSIGGAGGGARLSVTSNDTRDVLRLEGRAGSQSVLDIDGAIGENGIRVVTKGSERAILIDHVGANGTGIDLTMNNDNVVGLNMKLNSSLSTGIQIQSPDATNSKGLLIDNVNTGIDIDNVVFGLKVDVDSGLGSAVYGTSAENNLILFRGDLSGEFVKGVSINSTGRGSTGVYAQVGGSKSTGVWGIVSDETSFGVRGQASGESSIGVYGEAYDNMGIGVSGWSASGTGIYGSGTQGGIHGYLDGDTNSTAAVKGEAPYNTGSTYGGHFTTAGNSGSAGIRAEATQAGAFTTYGGYFTAASSMGRAILASATNGTTSYGIWAAGGGTGIYGRGQSAFATGVSGESTGANGKGVFGYGLNNGTAYGIYCASGLCGGLQAWSNISDERLKKNIVALEDAQGLDAIRKLRPVTYEWKSLSQPRGTQIGFIAQEVEKLIPEVVKNGSDQDIDLGNGKHEAITKVRSLSYAELTAPLVRAVQQLADKFDSLFDSVKKLIEQVSGHDAKITALEAENKALKARLDALEAKLAK